MTNRGGPSVVEDRVVTIRRTGSGRRSYLAFAPLVAAVAVVAVIGALGPRGSSNSPASLPSASATLDGLGPDSSDPRGPSGDPIPTPSHDLASELALGSVTADDSSISTLLVPAKYDGGVLAIAGQRVFIGRGNLVVEFDLDAPGDGRTVLDLGDGRVTGIAARGDRLAVLECMGSPPTPSQAPCIDCSCGPDYRVWLMSFEGGDARQVGAFTSPSDYASGSPPRLALGWDTWAISRAALSRGFTVEVHADSGKLLWSTSSDAPVLGLGLGGSRLLVLQAGGQAAGPAPEPQVRPMAHVVDFATIAVAVADAAHPDLVSVGWTAAGSSISSDGRSIAWDDGSCVDFMPLGDLADASTTAATCPTQGTFSYGSPSVDLSAAGTLNAAWLASGPQGTLLVVQSPRAGLSVVRNADNPTWTIVQGDALYWGKSTESGLEIGELDLARAEFLFS